MDSGCGSHRRSLSSSPAVSGIIPHPDQLGMRHNGIQMAGWSQGILGQEALWVPLQADSTLPGETWSIVWVSVMVSDHYFSFLSYWASSRSGLECDFRGLGRWVGYTAGGPKGRSWGWRVCDRKGTRASGVPHQRWQVPSLWEPSLEPSLRDPLCNPLLSPTCSHFVIIIYNNLILKHSHHKNRL